MSNQVVICSSFEDAYEKLSNFQRTHKPAMHRPLCNGQVINGVCQSCGRGFLSRNEEHRSDKGMILTYPDDSVLIIRET